MGNAAPTLESWAGLRTRFTSPFLWELERERFRGPASRGQGQRSQGGQLDYNRLDEDTVLH